MVKPIKRLFLQESFTLLTAVSSLSSPLLSRSSRFPPGSWTRIPGSTPGTINQSEAHLTTDNDQSEASKPLWPIWPINKKRLYVSCAHNKSHILFQTTNQRPLFLFKVPIRGQYYLGPRPVVTGVPELQAGVQLLRVVADQGDVERLVTLLGDLELRGGN